MAGIGNEGAQACRVKGGKEEVEDKEKGGYKENEMSLKKTVKMQVQFTLTLESATKAVGCGSPSWLAVSRLSCTVWARPVVLRTNPSLSATKRPLEAGTGGAETLSY